MDGRPVGEEEEEADVYGGDRSSEENRVRLREDYQESAEAVDRARSSLKVVFKQKARLATRQLVERRC